MNDVLSKGHAPAQNAKYDDAFLNEHDGSLLGSWEEDALKAILFTQVVVFTPQWCEFGFQCPRWNLDPWVYELPDSHFDIKQFALRVTALTNGFPLEEPLLWGALNPDGYSHSAIRSAPIQESHPLAPFFPDGQQSNVCPWRTDD